MGKWIDLGQNFQITSSPPENSKGIRMIRLAVAAILAFMVSANASADEATFALAQEYFNKGDFAGARTLLERGLDIGPKSALGHYYYAETLRKLDESDSIIIEHYNTAAKIDPSGEVGLRAIVEGQKLTKSVAAERVALVKYFRDTAKADAWRVHPRQLSPGFMYFQISKWRFAYRGPIHEFSDFSVRLDVIVVSLENGHEPKRETLIPGVSWGKKWGHQALFIDCCLLNDFEFRLYFSDNMIGFEENGRELNVYRCGRTIKKCDE